MLQQQIQGKLFREKKYISLHQVTNLGKEILQALLQVSCTVFHHL